MSGDSATTLAIVGTGNFATNLTALCARFGLRTVLFVDEFRTGTCHNTPVVAAADLTPALIAGVDKWVLAISDPAHRVAAVERLAGQGVPDERVLALHDDPDLQILHLLFVEHGPAAMAAFAAPGVTGVAELEERFLRPGWQRALAGLECCRPTIGLGYFGRGGGFRHHISSLVPLLAEEHNVLTMSDEVLGREGEAPRHLYLSTEAACRLDCLDLVLSAHVFPCAPPSVPRVSFAHVIYDLNLTAAYQAARLARSDSVYLFASSRPCLEMYLDMIRQYDLPNRVCLIPGGYLQLDRNLAAVAGYRGPGGSILYAPTLSLADFPTRWPHSDLVTSVHQGPAILQQLLDTFPDREVIFRPHPADLRYHELDRGDPRAVPFGRMLDICRDHARCRLDNQSSYLDSYQRAGLLISDTSSTAFTFAFTTGRPVIFFSPREDELVAALGEEKRLVGDRHQVGTVVTAVADLSAAVERLLQNSSKENTKLVDFRDQMTFNLGSAARYFVDNLAYVFNGEQHPDWHYFNW